MRNFNDNRRSGGGRSGGFGGGRSGGSNMMHQATCSDCGKDCEVPFKPTRGKDVFCNNCFKRDGDSRPGRDNRSGGRDRGGRGNDRGFGRSEERQMHDATCADCGNRCKVPFRPSNDKPIYCSDCFGDNKNKSFGPSKVDQSSEQFDELNKKLDKILKVLNLIHPKKVHTISKSEAEAASYSFDDEDDAVKVEDTEVKKPIKKVAKKATKKKATAKKAAKKTVKKTAAKKKPKKAKA